MRTKPYPTRETAQKGQTDLNPLLPRGIVILAQYLIKYQV